MRSAASHACRWVEIGLFGVLFVPSSRTVVRAAAVASRGARLLLRAIRSRGLVLRGAGPTPSASPFDQIGDSIGYPAPPTQFRVRRSAAFRAKAVQPARADAEKGRRLSDTEVAVAGHGA